MSRVCIDCGTSVSHKSTGRCRSCARKVILARPGFREAMAESQRRRWNERLSDPVARQQMSETGKAMRARAVQTPEVVEKQRAARSKLFWCPVEYRDLNTMLRRKGYSAPERKVIVLVQIAQEEKARQAARDAMTPFEKQLEKVRNGAALIERHPMPSRTHDFSLTGSSMGD